MRCNLLDLTCHAQGALWRWWDGLGFPVQALIVLGLIAIIVGVSWSLLAMLKRIGGWAAVAGFLAVVGGLVLAFLPKKPKDFTGEVDGRDAQGTIRPPKRKTLPFGRHANRTPKRRFNPDTGLWENMP
jgi:hypothetical protein